MNKSDAYLEVIFGPMFSGKTTYLIEKYRQHNYLGQKICVINFVLDQRYGTGLTSHDQTKIDCICLKKLNDIFAVNQEIVRESHVILINEGQFFEDLLEFSLLMVEKYKKIVYVAGLDTDFNRNKFGQIIDLIPYSDNIVKLHSLCGCCKDGTKAIFSKRLTQSKEQVEIGCDYVPLCRKCFLSS